MLAEYIDKAIEQAVYDIVEDERTYWGEIPDLQGVWARHATLEGCRRELREALSDWMALRLRLGLSIPVVAGIESHSLPKFRSLPKTENVVVDVSLGKKYRSGRDQSSARSSRVISEMKR